MIITIIGSVKENEKDMAIMKEFLSRLRNVVIYSPLDNQNGTIYDLQRAYIDKIAESNLVIAISKPRKCGGPWSLHFGESTTYELAMADFFGVPVIYVPSGMTYSKFWTLEKEEK